MNDRDYMLRAVKLAEKGRGFTNPNPVVGAVIVKDGIIIGEGWHEKYGELHAERNAIASLTESALGSTMYVTLEPCCHYGKTPPCTDAIIEAGISKVFIGSRDPNPKISGKGARILREAGITVEEDFLKDECDKLNPVFFHYITTGLPYVVMKYAMTTDGKISTHTGLSKWISGEDSLRMVHYMRHYLSGIMVGIETVLLDDPMLNVRIDGLESPTRIICDSHLRLPTDSNVFKTARDIHTIVACAFSSEDDSSFISRKALLEKAGIEVINFPSPEGRVDLPNLMKILGEKGIDSILLEGGGSLNESALKSGIVNHLRVFVAPKIFGGLNSKTPVTGSGVDSPADAYMLSLKNVSMSGEDVMLDYSVVGRRDENCSQE